jgi:transglutaminase-like putative cysteine protease
MTNWVCNLLEIKCRRSRCIRHVFFLIAASLFALLAACANAYAGDDAPGWLRQVASANTSSYGKEVPAVVLWDESRVTVDEDGKVTTTDFYAVRVLTREGRGEAVAKRIYNTDSGKVREMRAWMIRPAGEVKKYGKDQVIDVAIADNDVYNEARAKLIMAREDAEPGATFGYEVTSEERSVFTQLSWGFQNRMPTKLSRLTLSLPPGWRAESVTFNHPKIEPATSGTSYSWELRDLAFIEEEPLSPPITNLVPRLAVSYYPPAGTKPGIGKTFSNWADVSRWLTELSDSQYALDDALAGKAKQLTASAKTEFARIQAIGRYVQGVNYVSIQTGLGRGGGYRPHAAIDVFAKSYGDCKDKANLMRAMLKAVGIQSYLVCIYAGDPTYVRDEWPSPQQFNHCIIAVKVSAETEVPAVVNHPSLGRFMVFDPTDDNTPVGDLPDHEQGSLALIVAGDGGALLKMPTTPPEANRLERVADVMLAADGSITAQLRERARGQSAVDERAVFRGLSRPDYMKKIERWIARGASGASISKVEPADNSAEGRFALDVDFTAARYGQVMQDRLLVFKPAIVSRRDSLLLTESSRQHPVVLESHAYNETVKVKLPEGFVVDELPDAVRLDTPFGTYATTYVVKDGQLHFTRSLVLRGAIIPVAEYAKVRSFFERMRAAEETPVVLAKK